MEKYITTVMILLLSLLVSASKVHAENITVGAASSLRESLTSVAHAFEQNNPDIKVRLSFGGSATIARQIRAKAPIDVFVAADSGTMDSLEQSNSLIRKTRSSIIYNKLVLATALDTVSISSPFDLKKSSIKRVALCDEKVPVGHYTNLILKKAGLYKTVWKKSVKLSSVRGVLNMIATGAVDAGFVYSTDIKIAKGKVRQVWQAPRGFITTYPAAILTHSKEKNAALRFLNYLKSQSAQLIFSSYGFITGETM
jgi:molybdate transport system substrate-binding protein